MCAHVFLVADADQRRLEQAHHRRQHLVAREAAEREVGSTRRRIRGSAWPKSSRRSNLSRRDLAPARVVAVLLATLGVAAGRLEVAVRIGQIHTSVQAGGTASALIRSSTRRLVMRLPAASRYENPDPAFFRRIPGCSSLTKTSEASNAAVSDAITWPFLW